MSKIQLLVRAGGDHHARFAARVDAVLRELLAREPEGLKLTITEGPPPRVSVIPFERAPVALISIWSPSAELEPWMRIARSEGLDVSGYRVDESYPVEYARTWRDGERTPGVGLLTIFRRRRGLSDDELMRRWHGGHTPLSLEIHPLFAYVRNVVLEANGPVLDAIVEEHFRRREELLHPHVFFGGPLRMLPNMARVAADIAGFIDMSSLESFLVGERWIRSPT